MNDICACQNNLCSKKEKCYRYTALPIKTLQLYADFKEVDGKCDYFLPKSKLQGEINETRTSKPGIK